MFQCAVPRVGVAPTSELFQSPAVTTLAISAYIINPFLVGGTGLEPARSCDHNPLKVARLPIPPPAHVKLFYRID